MKAYKIELLIIDGDGLGAEGIKAELENANYGDCIYTDVKSTQEVDIGEWHDDHPLNQHSSADEYYQKHFINVTSGKMLAWVDNRYKRWSNEDSKDNPEKNAWLKKTLFGEILNELTEISKAGR